MGIPLEINTDSNADRSGVALGSCKRSRTNCRHHHCYTTEADHDGRPSSESSASCCSDTDGLPEIPTASASSRTSLCTSFSRRTMFASAAAALLICSSSVITHASAASPPPPPQKPTMAAFVTTPNYSHNHPLRPSRQSMSNTRKTPNNHRRIHTPDTWSNPVRHKTDTELNESRFGVRNRVKRVLDKAKKRTGIDNNSSAVINSERKNGASFTRSGADIVAETASLGGWDSDVDLISREKSEPGRLARDELDVGIISEGGEVDIIPNVNHKDDTTLSKYVDDSIDEVRNKVEVESAIATTVSESQSSVTEDLPEDDLVNVSTSAPPAGVSENNKNSDRSTVEVAPPAPSPPREPLPFDLPTLDSDQYRRVMNGERVQFQDDMGRAGSGFVVWDVRAPASVVWDCLLDFQSYPQTIPTVREVIMYTNTHLKEDYRAERPVDFEDGTAAICKHGVPSVTRAQFSLSKFRLKIAAVHKYRPNPNGDYMIFTLDPASTNVVLKYAKGIWHTESNPDGKEGYTRVWLLCELRVSKLLPQWIVDYAAARAMPRATTWLKPQVEAAATLWLRDSADS